MVLGSVLWIVLLIVGQKEAVLGKKAVCEKDAVLVIRWGDGLPYIPFLLAFCVLANSGTVRHFCRNRQLCQCQFATVTNYLQNQENQGHEKPHNFHHQCLVRHHILSSVSVHHFGFPNSPVKKPNSGRRDQCESAGESSLVIYRQQEYARVR